MTFSKYLDPKKTVNVYNPEIDIFVFKYQIQHDF